MVGWEPWIPFSSIIKIKSVLLSALCIQCSLTFFCSIALCLNDQVYQGGSLLAVAAGVAVLKALTTAKAEIGFRLVKNSMKFYIKKEEAKSK